MDHKEIIIRAATELIEERGEQISDITVREISKRAHVGLGLINYHFGNKDYRIAICVERVINGIVENFQSIREKTGGYTPVEKLEYLGNLTWTFMFEHYAMSKISVLSDMASPKEDDNTRRTYRAYLPLVAACRPDWDEEMLQRRTFCLIAVMQQVFLQYQVIRQLYGIDLTNMEERKEYHAKLLRDILEVKE